MLRLQRACLLRATFSIRRSFSSTLLRYSADDYYLDDSILSVLPPKKGNKKKNREFNKRGDRPPWESRGKKEKFSSTRTTQTNTKTSKTTSTKSPRSETARTTKTTARRTQPIVKTVKEGLGKIKVRNNPEGSVPDNDPFQLHATPRELQKMHSFADKNIVEYVPSENGDVTEKARSLGYLVKVGKSFILAKPRRIEPTRPTMLVYTKTVDSYSVWLSALEVLKKFKFDAQVNVLLLMQLDSGGLEKCISKEKEFFRNISAVVVSEEDSVDRTSIIYGQKQCHEYSMTVKGDRGTSGTIQEPYHTLVYLLSNLIDNGNTTANESLQKILNDSSSLKGLQSTISIQSISRSVDSVHAEFSVQLAEKMDMENVDLTVNKYFSTLHQSLNSASKMILKSTSNYPWWVSLSDHWSYSAASKAITSVFGVSPKLLVGNGSSSTAPLLQRHLGANILCLPFGNAYYLDAVKTCFSYMYYAGEEAQKASKEDQFISAETLGELEVASKKPRKSKLNGLIDPTDNQRFLDANPESANREFPKILKHIPVLDRRQNSSEPGLSSK